MLHFFVLLKPKQAKILYILNKSVFFQIISQTVTVPSQELNGNYFETDRTNLTAKIVTLSV